MVLAISPVATYALVLGTVLFICAAANVLHKPATRECPRCGRRVRMDARACRNCDYRFAIHGEQVAGRPRD